MVPILEIDEDRWWRVSKVVVQNSELGCLFWFLKSLKTWAFLAIWATQINIFGYYKKTLDTIKYEVWQVFFRLHNGSTCLFNCWFFFLQWMAWNLNFFQPKYMKLFVNFMKLKDLWCLSNLYCRKRKNVKGNCVDLKS